MCGPEFYLSMALMRMRQEEARHLSADAAWARAWFEELARPVGRLVGNLGQYLVVLGQRLENRGLTRLSA